MHLVRVLGDEVAYRRGALRHKRSLVEQPCRIEEGRQIGLDKRCAQIPRKLLRFRETELCIFVAEEELVLAARYAKAHARGYAPQ